MLDDPRVNFAITTRGSRKGVDHLGIQVENESELDELNGRLKTASAPVVEQGETACCYALSEKSWIFDPDGLAWESFLTKGESPVYGSGETRLTAAGSACCARPGQAVAQTSVSCCDGQDEKAASENTGRRA